ncbi:MAG TPA: xanthine dehydrogenase family protein molybdopterin-binding subunit [Gaiellaceae bacterium]|nr:xanthine dehydrogenase family protein molybdopterin-binding subunit [Gaiellaceae bacterium]
MTVTERVEPWVGRALPRIEDEALLRGLGRFMDDIDPVPHAGHAAILRSQLAHARIARLDATAALAAPGVLGVLTGADVAAMSRPFPAGVDSPIPYYAAAAATARYAGEPLAVVVARDRYAAEDAAELIEVDYEPLEPVMDAEHGIVVSDRSFSYGEVDEAFARADVVVSGRYPFPRWTCCPVETYGVICDWDAARGALTAWANFQGPFTLHSVAAAALGLPGSRLRLITPRDSGGSFGIKATTYVYVVLIGLASRKLGIPVRWTEDRMEHFAGSAASTARTTGLEAAFAADGELLALRYDSIEDVGAYLRAPEPATLYRMHGSLTGAYRVQSVAARNRVVLTNRCPTGLNRGFGGPQVYLALERTMDAAASRLEIDPAELRRRNLVGADEFPYRTPTGGLYDSGDYEACLDRALDLGRYAERREEQRAARVEGRLLGIGLAVVVEPSISNMGYITLANTAEERAGGLPKSGNAEGATVIVSPLGGVTVRVGTTPQGQGHATVCAQIVADALAIAPADVDVVTELDTSTSAWSVASGNYSSRFSGVGAGAVYLAAQKLAAKAQAIRDHLGDGSLSLRRVAGIAHWNPDALPEGMEPGLHETAFCAAPNLAPPDESDRVASSAAHGLVVDLAVAEVASSTGEVTVLDYVTVHDAGTVLNPALLEGQVRGGFAHGIAPALFERVVYDEDGNLLTGTFMDYLCPTGPDLPPLRIAHLESPSPFTPLGAKGVGEGNTMSVPAAIANAVADALGRDDVELPLTAPRVWELLS